jgi:hypothetical protein
MHSDLRKLKLSMQYTRLLEDLMHFEYAPNHANYLMMSFILWALSVGYIILRRSSSKYLSRNFLVQAGKIDFCFV